MDNVVKSIIDALVNDPAFHNSNSPSDLPWQIQLYKDRLAFLVSDFGFRVRQRRRAMPDMMKSYRVLTYRRPRTSISVWVTDRDRAFTLSLGTYWFGPLRRGTVELGWVVHLRTGGSELVADEEAIALGRDDARRLRINREAEFIRAQLQDFLRGDPAVVREADAFRRAYRRSPDGAASRYTIPPTALNRLDAAVRRQQNTRRLNADRPEP